MRPGRWLAVPAAAVALAFCATAADGGQVPVQDGRYAGGSSGFHIFFNVNDRTIPFARVYHDAFFVCNGFGGPAVFDSDEIDGQGRFKLIDDTTHTDNDFKVKGRFVKRNRVKGKVTWTTTDDCPAGTYEFNYRADRYAPVN